MPITVFKGLPGSGKSRRLIECVNEVRKQGRPAATFVCKDFPWPSNHGAFLIHRQLVCRVPGLTCKLDYFVSDADFAKLLQTAAPDSLIAVEETYAFGLDAMDAVIAASTRGLEIILAVPSTNQLGKLKDQPVTEQFFNMKCQSCNQAEATTTTIPPDAPSTVSLCQNCFDEQAKAARAAIVKHLREEYPFPGEDALYQPVGLDEVKDWRLARHDCAVRAEAMTRVIKELDLPLNGVAKQLTYLDMGCNTGFFCDHLAKLGFQAKGMDATERFIAVAKLLDSYFRRDQRPNRNFVIYERANAYEYLRDTQEEKYDVVSSFAMFQWVMVQRDAAHGIQCLEWFFEKARHLCILEMGYTKEEMYKENIGITIDREWVLNLMREKGNFAEIRVCNGGRDGLQRDLFIGIKAQGIMPTNTKAEAAFEAITATPNPIPAGPGAGQTEVTWKLPAGEVGEVTITVNGGEERQFARGQHGTTSAPWINLGARYEFRLYCGKDRKDLRGRVCVTKNSK